jgi:hypothetical protein
MGPANPRLQEPYHYSICPEQGNSKAQTKSFLPKHNPKENKGNKEESEQGKEYRNQADNTKNRGRRSNRGERE